MNVVQNQNREPGVFRDFYDGIKYKEFLSSLPPNQRQSYLTLLFNSDGSPSFKSFKFSIWPIQTIPNEIPAKIRHEKTVTFDIWFGHDKLDMVHFLKPFQTTMKNLSTNGIDCTINNENFNIKGYALCCCVDSIARAPMQGNKLIYT